MPPVMEWGFQGLTALSSLSIGGCDDIVKTLLMEPLLPISLVSLTISYLHEMKSFEGNGLQHLSSLENLHFRKCQQLESFPENCLPSSLKSLKFGFCERLESLLVNFQSDIYEIYDVHLIINTLSKTILSLVNTTLASYICYIIFIRKLSVVNFFVNWNLNGISEEHFIQ
jgi:hypothetical protein